MEIEIKGQTYKAPDMTLLPESTRGANGKLEELSEDDWTGEDWMDLLIAQRWVAHRVMSRHNINT